MVEKIDIESEITSLYEKSKEIKSYLMDYVAELTLVELNTVLQGLDSVGIISVEAYDFVLKRLRAFGDSFYTSEEFMEEQMKARD